MTGLILLAAGASTRLGKPKQNLVFEGETLLQRALQTALDSVCSPVILVLPPDPDRVLPGLTGAPVTIAVNQEWKEGMASSIRCGLEQLLTIEPDVSSCIFMVCDQPYVTASVLDNLVKEHRGTIVASTYQDTLGTPVLFDKSYFPELMQLQGQEGAKKIVMKHRQDVLTIPFPLGEVDIDTAADYNSLLQKGAAG